MMARRNLETVVSLVVIGLLIAVCGCGSGGGKGIVLGPKPPPPGSNNGLNQATDAVRDVGRTWVQNLNAKDMSDLVDDGKLVLPVDDLRKSYPSYATSLERGLAAYDTAWFAISGAPGRTFTLTGIVVDSKSPGQYSLHFQLDEPSTGSARVTSETEISLSQPLGGTSR